MSVSDLQAEHGLTSSAAVSESVAAFLYREARLADEHQYAAWEALWDDSALYWVPRDPNKGVDEQMSYIADNRARISSRVAQLKTGHRYSQAPQSSLRRQLGNLEVVDERDDELEVAANFVIYEYRDVMNVWAGRCHYTLVSVDGDYRLRRKVVALVNAVGPIPTLGFLI